MFGKQVIGNGIRVLVEEVPSVRSVSVGIWVDAGSRDETPAESGASHFIEHMIFKGTESRSALDIAKEFDRMGGFSNAFTSREQTCFHAKVLDTHLDQVMELLADIFLNSKFDPEELDRERMVILQEINMVEDSPDDLVHDLFYRSFWPGAGLGQPILGTQETVSGFDSSTLRRYMAEKYVGDRIVVAAAGNVRAEEFTRLVEAHFGSVPGHSAGCGRRRPAPAKGVWLHTKALEQVHLVLGFEGISASSAERFAATLLNVIWGGSMSSRLFQEVREKRGLAYSIYSFNSSYQDTGVTGVYAGIDAANIEETASIVMDQLRALAESGPSSDELQAAKDHVKGGLLLSAENSDSRMSRIAKMELYLGEYLTYDEVVQRIEAVTPEDVARVAAGRLQDGGSATILGPAHADAAAKVASVIGVE